MKYKGFEITTMRVAGNSVRCWDGKAVIPGDDDSCLLVAYQYTENDVVEQLKRFIDYWTQPVEELEAQNEKLTAALRRLFTWTAAYPLDIFPEPDLAQVAAVLKAAGLTLDAVSVSNMRHVLNGVMDTLREAGIGVEDLEERR